VSDGGNVLPGTCTTIKLNVVFYRIMLACTDGSMECMQGIEG